ncbi:MAG: hypothetical protein RMJ67_07835 [Elusimicrobiota bacterium]|nr:hypothetical protein [Endomicrobiia bacterium]MDW8166403.1 hypothetical protein [Elusimicrobiota bacterium]
MKQKEFESIFKEMGFHLQSLKEKSYTIDFLKLQRLARTLGMSISLVTAVIGLVITAFPDLSQACCYSNSCYRDCYSDA